MFWLALGAAGRPAFTVSLSFFEGEKAAWRMKK